MKYLSRLESVACWQATMTNGYFWHHTAFFKSITAASKKTQLPVLPQRQQKSLQSGKYRVYFHDFSHDLSKIFHCVLENSWAGFSYTHFFSKKKPIVETIWCACAYVRKSNIWLASIKPLESFSLYTLSSLFHFFARDTKQDLHKRCYQWHTSLVGGKKSQSYWNFSKKEVLQYVVPSDSQATPMGDPLKY